MTEQQTSRDRLVLRACRAQKQHMMTHDEVVMMVMSLTQNNQKQVSD